MSDPIWILQWTNKDPRIQPSIFIIPDSSIFDRMADLLSHGHRRRSTNFLNFLDKWKIIR